MHKMRTSPTRKIPDVAELTNAAGPGANALVSGEISVGIDT